MIYCILSICTSIGLPTILLLYFLFYNSQQMILTIGGSIGWLISLCIISVIWSIPYVSSYWMIIQIISGLIKDIMRIGEIFLIKKISKKLDMIKYGGIGLGVGAALCQVLVHNLPYLTLSSKGTDFYQFDNNFGTFSVNTINGLLYSIYIIFSYAKLYEIFFEERFEKKNIMYIIWLFTLHLIILLCTGFISMADFGVYIEIAIMILCVVVTCIIFCLHVYRERNIAKRNKLLDESRINESKDDIPIYDINSMENGASAMIEDDEINGNN